MSFYYSAMLRRAHAICHSISQSVSQSVCLCDVQVGYICFPHRLEYFENNFIADYLKVLARADLNIRDKVSNIIWRYTTPCWPVSDCKMNDPQNDLEWLLHVKIRFRPALLDSGLLTLKNNCCCMVMGHSWISWAMGHMGHVTQLSSDVMFTYSYGQFARTWREQEEGLSIGGATWYAGYMLNHEHTHVWHNFIRQMTARIKRLKQKKNN